MCKVIEDMKKEVALREKIKTAVNLLKKNLLSYEDISEVTELPIKDVQELAHSLNSNS